jgi:hypothetical protein
MAVGGEWRPRDEAGALYLLTLIQGGLEYVRYNAPSYPQGTVTHHHGLDDHRSFLEAPFLEALTALRDRYPDLAFPS